ncbi:MAG: DNA polymerase III subunit beta, partial [Pantoea sp. Brub]|nr:DNA polymerase III subunit beta [Pantoea sp. Brub]
LDISYNDDKLEMCFNVNYILDVLNVLKCKTVRLLFNKSNFSLYIENTANADSFYVIMPVRF